MCWHILALFYVVSVRYVFYIVKAPVYSHISVFSYSVWKYVVQEALQFLGGLCYINKFLLVEYMFPILQFSLFWKNLTHFCLGSGKQITASVLESAEQLSDPRLQAGCFVS